MKTKLLALLFLYLLLFLTSCECVSPMCFDLAGFTLVDKTTGKDLIFGSNPIYFKDSMFTKTTTDPSFRSVGTLDSLRLFLPNNDTIYLRLNSLDIDTIIVKYATSDRTYCCKNGVSTLTSITYNGISAIKQGNRFLFGK